MNLKRLWDTDNKKIVRAIPTGDPHKKLQVWTNDDGSKLYVYIGSAFRELDLAGVTVSEYGPVWKELDDETVGYYLTNEPTDLYNWDEGDDVTYTFKDYDGTVLKTGKIEEGETPTPPADPTRTGYTFTGWNPTVAAITKKTTYTAQYTIDQYTVTITSNNTDYGTVSSGSVEVPYGTDIITDENTITFGIGATAVTVTATALYGYYFDAWTTEETRGKAKEKTRGGIPSNVTGNLSIIANFEELPLWVSTVMYDDSYGIVKDGDNETVANEEGIDVYEGTVVTVNNNVCTIGTGDNAEVLTATAGEDCTFDGWTYYDEELGDYTSFTSLTIEGDVEIAPIFHPAPVTFTIAIDPSGSGELTDEDGDEVTTITCYEGDDLYVDGFDTSILCITDFYFEKRYSMVPTGSNTLVGAYLSSEEQITETPITIETDDTITIKFQENSR